MIVNQVKDDMVLLQLNQADCNALATACDKSLSAMAKEPEEYGADFVALVAALEAVFVLGFHALNGNGDDRQGGPA